MTHVIHFDTAGRAKCLWSDDLPLATIGTLAVKRASTVEYNNLVGWWEVRIGGKLKVAHSSRQWCLNWELKYFNDQLLAK